MKDMLIEYLKEGQYIEFHFEKNNFCSADSLIDPLDDPNYIYVGLTTYQTTYLINLQNVTQIKILSN
ncbi:hypothetical protein [Enterococcus casseliflavus]|uniref:hypothetical protein n=1 Tax=Enterococcus casseliflavus TaxID=37734 RepID=UPI0022E4A4E9|nr:hypothetical protein [Enterococcus casseliflavus]